MSECIKFDFLLEEDIKYFEKEKEKIDAKPEIFAKYKDKIEKIFADIDAKKERFANRRDFEDLSENEQDEYWQLEDECRGIIAQMILFIKKKNIKFSDDYNYMLRNYFNYDVFPFEEELENKNEISVEDAKIFLKNCQLAEWVKLEKPEFVRELKKILDKEKNIELPNDFKQLLEFLNE